MNTPNFTELINLKYVIDPNKKIDSPHLYIIPEEVKQKINSKSFWEYLAGMIDANGFFGFGTFKFEEDSHPRVGWGYPKKKKPYSEFSLYVPKQHLSLLLFIYKNLQTIFKDNGIDSSEYIDNKYFMIWDEYWVDTHYKTKLGYHRLAISSIPLMTIILKNLSGLIQTKKLNHEFSILSTQLDVRFKPPQELQFDHSWFMGYFDMKGSIQFLEIPSENSKSRFYKVLNMNIYGYNDLLVVNLFHSMFQGNIKRDFLKTKIKDIHPTARLQLIKATDITTFKEYSQICPSLVDHSLKLALIHDYFNRYKDKESTRIFFRNWNQTDNIADYNNKIYSP